MSLKDLDWIDNDYPGGEDGGDHELIENITDPDLSVCSKPLEIECRAKEYRDMSLKDLGQIVTCNPSVGLICLDKDQGIPPLCNNYEIRVKCCVNHCKPSTTTAPSTTTTTKGRSTTTSAKNTEKLPTTTITGRPTTTTTITEKPTWSDWIDNDYPGGEDGGDHELIENITDPDLSVCSKPLEIECRAKEYRDMSLKDLGQIVTCNPSVGLICLDKDQGIPPLCNNYEIRVKCCVNHCKPSTTTAPSTTTTTKGRSTTTSAKNTEKLPTTTITGRPTTTTTITEKPTTTSTITEIPTTTTTITEKPTATTAKEQTTAATTTEVPSTPVKTTENPITTAVTTTEKPATTTPEVWSDWIDNDYPGGEDGGDHELIENITDPDLSVCSKPLEIECRAKEYRDMSLKDLGQIVTCNPSVGLICLDKDQGIPPLCNNYEIRVKCCVNHCKPSTTTAPSTTTTTKGRSTTTSAKNTEKLPTTTITGRPTTTTTITEKPTWSDWIDNDYPGGEDGGDHELIENITDPDLSVCSKPLEIECRAKEYRDMSLKDLGQIVTCNPSVGLICLDKDQGIPPLCNNYEIRVKCCVNHCKPSTTTAPSTTTTTKGRSTTTSAKNTEKLPTTTITGRPTTTTTITEKPTTTSTITEIPTTTTTITEKPTATTAKEQTTAATTTEVPSTPVKTTENPITTAVTTTEKPATTTPEVWSDWIDNDYPGGEDGGDHELIENITDPDLSVCSKPLEIECRAKEYRDMSLKDLGQIVTCNPSVGLICLDKDQGIPPLCNNYEIRVKCCVNHCKPSTTTAPSTTTTTKGRSTTTSAKNTEKLPTTTITGRPTTTTTITEKPTTTSTITEIPTTTTTITEKPTATTAKEQTTAATTTEVPSTPHPSNNHRKAYQKDNPNSNRNTHNHRRIHNNNYRYRKIHHNTRRKAQHYCCHNHRKTYHNSR
ncbi:mucin-5AC-like [Anarhichas minor]|uniref:mucin-5AC-like n=1 Tax=Anarhichas minor TaxID=65739 RepID=UPI003F7335FA